VFERALACTAIVVAIVVAVVVVVVVKGVCKCFVFWLLFLLQWNRFGAPASPLHKNTPHDSPTTTTTTTTRAAITRDGLIVFDCVCDSLLFLLMFP